MSRKYSCLVVQEIHNAGTFLERVVSDRPLDFERDLVPFFRKKDDTSFDRDGLTLVNEPVVVEFEEPDK